MESAKRRTLGAFLGKVLELDSLNGVTENAIGACICRALELDSRIGVTLGVCIDEVIELDSIGSACQSVKLGTCTTDRVVLLDNRLGVTLGTFVGTVVGTVVAILVKSETWQHCIGVTLK